MHLEKTVLISCDAEFCAYRRGGSLGPGALLTAARQQNERLLLDLEFRALHVQNLELHRPVSSPNAKYIEAFVPLFKALGSKVAAALQERRFPICLTGDHSQGVALLHGVKQVFPDSRLGVVWIDAHADLHSPFTTPSGNVHGMPLAIALGEDNLGQRRNSPNPETIELWSQLKEASGPTSIIRPEDLVYIGVRDIEAEEAYLIEKLGIQCYDVQECRSMGMQQVVTKTLNQLRDCDYLFISFDVDSMDPDKVSDGTGTPVPGGFLEDESTRLLDGLMTDERVLGLEITEINPTLDTGGNTMAEACLRILKRCCYNSSTNAEVLSL